MNNIKYVEVWLYILGAVSGYLMSFHHPLSFLVGVAAIIIIFRHQD